jgi:transcriptional regulator with XRE-family HTH domain
MAGSARAKHRQAKYGTLQKMTGSIGSRLRRRRIERGLNQKAVAEAVGVTNAAVSKWESNGGQSISAIVALKVSELLNVNPFWLIYGTGDPNDKIEMPDLSESARDIARRIDRLPGHVRDALGKLLLAL